jgi:hypothetical protein
MSNAGPEMALRCRVNDRVVRWPVPGRVSDVVSVPNTEPSVSRKMYP